MGVVILRSVGLIGGIFAGTESCKVPPALGWEIPEWLVVLVVGEVAGKMGFSGNIGGVSRVSVG